VPIPDYETIMLPLLRHLEDGGSRGTQETLDELGREFSLSDAERRQLLPSGRQPLFTNRVAWAKFYLKKAGLIESPRRGIYRISERGKTLLDTKPEQITAAFLLDRYPDFRDFYTRARTQSESPAIVALPESSRTTTGGGTTTPRSPDRTPEELLELGYSQIQEGLAADLLQRAKEGSPEFFEKLVIDLLIRLGYGGSRADAGRRVGGSGDGGIDGIINQDPLGLDSIYIQAKRWEGAVGRQEIQKFAGALQGQRATKGVFITTSSFTRDATNYVETISSKIILIDGEQLAKLMITHGLGVTKVAQFDVNRIDSDYFSEEE
jgi:restriction system protein